MKSMTEPEKLELDEYQNTSEEMWEYLLDWEEEPTEDGDLVVSTPLHRRVNHD